MVALKGGKKQQIMTTKWLKNDPMVALKGGKQKNDDNELVEKFSNQNINFEIDTSSAWLGLNPTKR